MMPIATLVHGQGRLLPVNSLWFGRSQGERGAGRRLPPGDSSKTMTLGVGSARDQFDLAAREWATLRVTPSGPDRPLAPRRPVP
jgi:hypothetical protein